MDRPPPQAIAVTRRLFLGAGLLLVLEVTIGWATWPTEPWRTGVVVLGFTTFVFAAILGTLLAGERWTALGAFTHLHAWVVVAAVMGTAAALLGYVAYPDPAMLLIGPFVLGCFVLLGWGFEKMRLLGL